MKKRIALVAVLLATFGGLFMLHQPVHALSTFNSKGDGDVVIGKDVVHGGSYYASGRNITINGTINGDLYCAGQNVKINGTVNGDVLCAAQRLTVNGVVSQDVRSAGQLITIAGQVGGSVSAFGQEITVAKGASVGGDLNGAGQTFTVDGMINRDVAVAGQDLAVDGLVKGSVNANVESLSLSSKPAIMGGLIYTSKTSQNLADGSVLGAVKFTQVKTKSENSNSSNRFAVTFYSLAILSLIVTATALSLLVPRYFERSYVVTRKKLGLAVLIGITANLALPILAVVLMFTVIGIPLAILLLVSLLLVQMLAFSFVAYYLSRALLGKSIHNVVLLMVIGAALMAILMMAPILNIFVFMATVVLGVGGIIITATDGYQKPSYDITESTATEKTRTPHKK